MLRRLLSGLRESTRLIRAAQPDAVTTPVSNKRVPLQGPVPRASPKTIRMETKEPASANQGRNTVAAPSNIPSRVAKAAPPDTPSTYGSANGFRNSTCIRQPDMASIAPTNHAAIARGRRKRQINSPCALLESPIAAHHCCQPIETELKVLATNKLAADSSNNMNNNNLCDVIGII